MPDSRHHFETDPAWARALTFAERLGVLRKAGPGHCDLDSAQRRDGRWRKQASLTDEARFVARLAEDGASAAEWLQVLGERPEAWGGAAFAHVDWAEALAQAYGSAHEGAASEPTSSALIELFRPLSERARSELRQGAAKLVLAYPQAPFTVEVADAALWPALAERLHELSSRTLVLELNVARLEGRLQGDTRETRFQSFVRSLGDTPLALRLLAEYPVLARQAAVACAQWTRAGLELLGRLAADAPVLAATFTEDGALGMLQSVRSAGDQHRGGRAVAVIAFDGGQRVVYKPRSLAIDRHFSELVSWARARGLPHELALPKVVEGDGYGWVMHVAPKPCAEVGEVRRFYERQGIYLALFYALNATDFHSENLIAVGEQPLPIDLEALFHPPPELTALDTAAVDALTQSVVRIGLLPQWLWADEDATGIEISGLGGSKGQLSPRPVAYPTDVGTDEMRFTSGRLKMRDNDNRPTLLGEEVDLLDHAGALEAAFSATYRFLVAQREALLADDGPLASFANDEVRVLLRPTRFYALLLEAAGHPDALRDGLDRDQLFDKLWLSASGQPSLARVIPDEREELHRGDIPVFVTRPGSRDLWTGSGRQIEGFFAESSLDAVRKRVRQLSEADRERQIWLIQASFSALERPAPPAALDPTFATASSAASEGDPRALGAAQRIGARLAALSLRTSATAGPATAEWLGLSIAAGRRWSTAPLGLDLYAGTPGVALFLAYLGAVTGDDGATKLAEEALATVRRALAQDTLLAATPGGFDGWGGVVYVFAHLGSLWGRPELLDEAETLVERFALRPHEDAIFDIIAGSAGCIGGLLALVAARRSPRALAAALACGEHLLATATPMAQGIGWLGKIAERPTSGFSHGAAGIAWALLRLFEASGQERFRDAAAQAIAYERSLYSPAARNWRDLLRDDEGEAFGVSWCHGAPGIGLARLATLPLLDNEQTRDEIDAATQTTLSQGFGGTHSLCHGELGNVELLRSAATSLGDASLRAQADAAAGAVLDGIAKRGFLCGVPRAVETPGLMTGLAGIGWGLLRLHDPARVPSVLVLEPPRGSEGATLGRG